MGLNGNYTIVGSASLAYKNGNVEFTTDELKEVADSYGIGNIVGTPVLERGGLSNYTFHVCTDRGDFMVRARPEELSERALASRNLEHAVTTHIAGKDLPFATPLFRTAKDGNKLVVLNGKTYDCYGRINGEHISFGDSIREDAVEAVALYHKAMEDFPTDTKPSKPHREYDAAGWLKDRLVAIGESANSDTELDVLVRKNFPFVIDTYDFLRTHAKPNPPVVVCHGDVHAGNFLYTNGKLSGMIDFGNVRWGSREGDLSKLIKAGPELATKATEVYRRYNSLTDQEAGNLLPERILGVIHGIRWIYEGMEKAPERKPGMMRNHLASLRETVDSWEEQLGKK